MSEGEKPGLHPVEARRKAGVVVDVAVVVAAEALDDGTPGGRDVFEDDPYGADEVELDDTAP